MQRAPIPRLCGAAALLVVAAWALAACGGGGTSTSSQVGQTAEAPGRIMTIGGPPKGKPIRGFCGRATVRPGTSPGSLEVSAKCVPARENPYVNLAFLRYPSDRLTDPPASPGQIRRVYVEGPGEPVFERCKRRGKGFLCGARARGPIRLHVVDVVPARTRCRFRVDVSTSVETGCPHDRCIGVMSRYALYSGRPKGC